MLRLYQKFFAPGTKARSVMGIVVEKKANNLPREERLQQCEQLIDKAQSALTRNRQFMSPELIRELGEIISAAQLELSHILRESMKQESY